jgi:hypothetical protein
MIDVNVLRGSTVRDSAGTRGEVLGLSLPWVRIGWWDEGSASPRVEAFLRSDPRIEDIEVLTIGEGWVSARSLFGAKVVHEEGPHGPSLLNDLDALVQEASKHSPYKTAASTGPSIRGGWPPPPGAKKRLKKHKKKGDWECKCANYVCKCVGKEGQKKTVNLTKSKSWKLGPDGYNMQYKAHHSAKMDIAAPSRIKKRLKKKAKARKKKK